VDGLLLAFREVPDYRPLSWPGSSIQMHLEVYVDDLARQERRLLSCGATKPDEQNEDDPTLIVLLDPSRPPVLHLRATDVVTSVYSSEVQQRQRPSARPRLSVDGSRRVSTAHCGSSAKFGTKRSQVQILSPRPCSA
jgi:hypothetical protein